MQTIQDFASVRLWRVVARTWTTATSTLFIFCQLTLAKAHSKAMGAKFKASDARLAKLDAQMAAMAGRLTTAESQLKKVLDPVLVHERTKRFEALPWSFYAPIP